MVRMAMERRVPSEATFLLNIGLRRLMGGHNAERLDLRPLDYRYGCQDFKQIWSEDGRHERQLEVERALVGLTSRWPCLG